MKRSVLALLLFGCSSDYALHVVLYTQEDADPVGDDSEHAELVREAVGLLGYNTRFTTRKRGAIAIEILPVQPLTFIGRRLVDEGCYRAAWAMPIGSRNVAHEVGHVLGLDHMDVDGNMMRQGGTESEIDLASTQVDTLDFNTAELRRCR